MKSPNKMSAGPMAALAILALISGCAGSREALLKADMANNLEAVEAELAKLLGNVRGAVIKCSTNRTMEDAIKMSQTNALRTKKGESGKGAVITGLETFRGNSYNAACARSEEIDHLSPKDLADIRKRIQFKGDNGNRTVPRQRERK